MENSLVNVYEDGKIIAYDFKLKWPVGTIFSSVNLLGRVRLKVDGKEIPEDRIYIILKGQKIKNFEKSNLTFNPVELITMGVYERGGISQGNHEIKLTIEFVGSPGPAVSTEFCLQLGNE